MWGKLTNFVADAIDELEGDEPPLSPEQGHGKRGGFGDYPPTRDAMMPLPHRDAGASSSGSSSSSSAAPWQAPPQKMAPTPPAAQAAPTLPVPETTQPEAQAQAGLNHTLAELRKRLAMADERLVTTRAENQRLVRQMDAENMRLKEEVAALSSAAREAAGAASLSQSAGEEEPGPSKEQAREEDSADLVKVRTELAALQRDHAALQADHAAAVASAASAAGSATAAERSAEAGAESEAKIKALQDELDQVRKQHRDHQRLLRAKAAACREQLGVQIAAVDATLVATEKKKKSVDDDAEAQSVAAASAESGMGGGGGGGGGGISLKFALLQMLEDAEMLREEHASADSSELTRVVTAALGRGRSAETALERLVAEAANLARNVEACASAVEKEGRASKSTSTSGGRIEGLDPESVEVPDKDRTDWQCEHCDFRGTYAAVCAHEEVCTGVNGSVPAAAAAAASAAAEAQDSATDAAPTTDDTSSPPSSSTTALSSSSSSSSKAKVSSTEAIAANLVRVSALCNDLASSVRTAREREHASVARVMDKVTELNRGREALRDHVAKVEERYKKLQESCRQAYEREEDAKAAMAAAQAKAVEAEAEARRARGELASTRDEGQRRVLAARDKAAKDLARAMEGGERAAAEETKRALAELKQKHGEAAERMQRELDAAHKSSDDWKKIRQRAEGLEKAKQEFEAQAEAERRRLEAEVQAGDGAKQRVQELGAELKAVRADLLMAERDAEQTGTALRNLEGVLVTFQQEREEEQNSASERLASVHRRWDEEVRLRRLADANAKAAQAEAVADAVAKTRKEELRARFDLVNEAAALRHGMAEATKRIQEMVDEGVMVDKRILGKLLVRYFDAGSSRSVMKIIAKMLELDEQQKKSVGLISPAAAAGGGGASGLFAALWGAAGSGSEAAGGAASAASSSSPSAAGDGDGEAGDSFSEMWVDFLLKETAGGGGVMRGAAATTKVGVGVGGGGGGAEAERVIIDPNLAELVLDDDEEEEK